MSWQGIFLSIGLMVGAFPAVALTAEVEAGMDLPVQMIGAKMRFNINDHFFGVGGMGFTSASMAQLLADSSYTFGQTSKETSEVLGASLEKSLYLNLQLGYDFKRSGGWYIMGGYSVFLNGGGHASGNEIEGLVGRDLVAITASQNAHVESNVHNLTAHLGYSWFFDMFAFYWEFGLVKPVYATSKVILSESVNSAVLDEEDQVVKDMDSAWTGDIWIYTTGFWISYNF